jgi:hypothetical protein
VGRTLARPFAWLYVTAIIIIMVKKKTRIGNPHISNTSMERRKALGVCGLHDKR